MKLKLLAIAFLLILTLNKIQAQIPSYIPKDSLVGWWPFNGNANDESGNGNHGTVNGATLSDDRNNNSNSCYLFDGKSNFISIEHLDSSRYKPITFSCWVNNFSNDSLNTDGGKVIMGREQFGYYYQGSLMSYNYSPSNVYNRISYYQGNTNTYSNFNLIKNKWNNIIITINDSNYITFYINGQINSTVKMSTFSTVFIPFLIGAGTGPNGIGNRFFWDGKIDDIGIWNRALDSNEIKSMYNGSTANVQNKNSNSKIKVYPNPAKDHLVIDFGNYYSITGYEITIFDVAGKSVYSSTINKSSETIDLNTWNGKGVYFLKIYDKLNQQIENRKIVIE